MHDRPPSLGRRKLLGLAAAVAAAGSLSPLPGRARERRLASSPRLEPGTFTVEVDDITLYCEVRGSGPLLIVQNGAWFDTFTSLFTDPLMNALAKQHTLLTFDARGQGRSSAGKGPITYGRLAADTVRLMDELGTGSAHFIGHSDGGCIQLRLLVDFPDRVRTATLLGTPYSHEAYSASTQALFSEWFEQMVRGETLDDGPRLQDMERRYREVSPHPERLGEMRLQQRRCWSTGPNVSLRQLATITRPVLVVEAGKDEFIPREQFAVLADSIPGSERVYFPDLTHDIVPYVDRISQVATRFAAKHASI